jgi:hypothetical protein
MPLAFVRLAHRFAWLAAMGGAIAMSGNTALARERKPLSDALAAELTAAYRTAPWHAVYTWRGGDGKQTSLEVYRQADDVGFLHVGAEGERQQVVSNGLEVVRGTPGEGLTVGEAIRRPGAATVQRAWRPIEHALDCVRTLNARADLDVTAWHAATHVRTMVNPLDGAVRLSWGVGVGAEPESPDYLEPARAPGAWVASVNGDLVELGLGEGHMVTVERVTGLVREVWVGRGTAELQRVLWRTDEERHPADWWKGAIAANCAQGPGGVSLDAAHAARRLTLSRSLWVVGRNMNSLTWTDLDLLTSMVSACVFTSEDMRGRLQEFSDGLRAEYTAQSATPEIQALSPDAAKKARRRLKDALVQRGETEIKRRLLEEIAAAEGSLATLAGEEKLEGAASFALLLRESLPRFLRNLSSDYDFPSD